MTDVEQIKVGRDGLLMKNGDNDGLLIAAGSRGAEVEPRNIPRTDMRQGRHGPELLERREHRHLQFHRSGIQGSRKEREAIGSTSQPAAVRLMKPVSVACTRAAPLTMATNHAVLQKPKTGIRIVVSASAPAHPPS